MKKKILLVLVCSLVLGLCACGNSGNVGNGDNVGSNSQTGQVGQNGTTNETPKQEPKEVVIELTTENFFDYFELKPNIIIERNAFDEICVAYLDMWLLSLKEEYVEKFVDYDFAIEPYIGAFDESTNEGVYHEHNYICTYNSATEEFSYEIEEVRDREIRYDTSMWMWKSEGRDKINDTTLVFSREDTVLHWILDVDGDVVRWQQDQQVDWNRGVVRVKGTLTLME